MPNIQDRSERASAHEAVSARQLHDKLKRALAELRRAEKNAVLIFAEILERKLYRELGYSSIHAYAARELNFSKSKTSQFIQLAQSLKQLPELKRSLSKGELSWTKAREVARIATPSSEKDWVRTAKTSTRRELESKVRSVRKINAQARRHDPCQYSLESSMSDIPQVRRLSSSNSVVFKLDELQLAQFDVCLERLRKQGRRESRADLLLEALALLANQVKQSESDDSTREFTRVNSSAYQIVVYRCKDCGSGKIVTSRGELPISKEQLASIECDARVLKPGERNRSTIPPAVRRAVLARDDHRCRAAGCENSRFLEVHHIQPRRRGGGHEAANLITLCSACHALLHERGASLMLPVPAGPP